MRTTSNHKVNKLSLDDPDMGLWTYAYDALSNLTQQTDARGCVTSLAYDGLNRLTGKTYSNASGGSCAAIAASTPAVSYGYDAGTYGKLQRTSMTDGSGSIQGNVGLEGHINKDNLAGRLFTSLRPFSNPTYV